MAPKISSGYLRCSTALIELEVVAFPDVFLKTVKAVFINLFVRGQQNDLMGGNGEVALNEVLSVGGIKATQGRVDDGRQRPS